MSRTDDRLQNLLNLCGQTLSDLPTAYSFEHTQMCRNTAMQRATENKNEQAPLTQYACHMADVIDRLELALINEHARNADSWDASEWQEMYIEGLGDILRCPKCGFKTVTRSEWCPVCGSHKEEYDDPLDNV